MPTLVPNSSKLQALRDRKPMRSRTSLTAMDKASPSPDEATEADGPADAPRPCPGAGELHVAAARVPLRLERFALSAIGHRLTLTTLYTYLPSADPSQQAARSIATDTIALFVQMLNNNVINKIV